MERGNFKKNAKTGAAVIASLGALGSGTTAFVMNGEGRAFDGGCLASQPDGEVCSDSTGIHEGPLGGSGQLDFSCEGPQNTTYVGREEGTIVVTNNNSPDCVNGSAVPQPNTGSG